MNYVMQATMYLESLVSQENQTLENNAVTEKTPIRISSMQSGMDVVSSPTSHDNEHISIVDAGQENSTPLLNNEDNSVSENVQVPNLVSDPSHLLEVPNMYILLGNFWYFAKVVAEERW